MENILQLLHHLSVERLTTYCMVQTAGCKVDRWKDLYRSAPGVEDGNDVWLQESKDAYSKDSDNSDSGFEVSSDENQSLPGSPRDTRDEARPIIRLCVSAAYFGALAQRTEVALLGIRTLSDESNIVEAVRTTVEQVCADFPLPFHLPHPHLLSYSLS